LSSVAERRGSVERPNPERHQGQNFVVADLQKERNEGRDAIRAEKVVAREDEVALPDIEVTVVAAEEWKKVARRVSWFLEVSGQSVWADFEIVLRCPFCPASE
jgi:hypothetical protein